MTTSNSSNSANTLNKPPKPNKLKGIWSGRREGWTPDQLSPAMRDWLSPGPKGLANILRRAAECRSIHEFRRSYPSKGVKHWTLAFYHSSWWEAVNCLISLRRSADDVAYLANCLKASHKYLHKPKWSRCRRSGS